MDLQGLKNNISRRLVRLTNSFSDSVLSEVVKTKGTTLNFAAAKNEGLYVLSVENDSDFSDIPFDRGTINDCFMVTKDDPMETTLMRGKTSFGCSETSLSVNIHTLNIGDYIDKDTLLGSLTLGSLKPFRIAIVINKMEAKPDIDNMALPEKRGSVIRELETDFSVYYIWENDADEEYKELIYNELGLDKLALQIEGINDENIFSQRPWVARRGLVKFLSMDDRMWGKDHFLLGFKYKYYEEINVNDIFEEDSNNTYIGDVAADIDFKLKNMEEN